MSRPAVVCGRSRPSERDLEIVRRFGEFLARVSEPVPYELVLTVDEPVPYELTETR